MHEHARLISVDGRERLVLSTTSVDATFDDGPHPRIELQR